MTYPEVIRYLNSFTDYEKNVDYSYAQTFDLRRMRDFLKFLGSPQEALKVIHVAGSKGKGSTAVFIAYILRQAGFSVGLYTSPHLHDFRERIRILKPGIFTPLKPAPEFEGQISQQALINLVVKLKPRIAAYYRQEKYGKFSFFEVYTALALLYFKHQKTDFVVLEAGLGGRLDATNAVSALVSVITPISYEHTQKLGKTLTLIAKEKAGIIKTKGALVITAAQNLAVRKVILERCKEFQGFLFEVGKQIKYWKTKSSFTVKGRRRNYTQLHLQLLGEHQIENAALAIGAVEGLGAYHFYISARAIRQGLAQSIWPGRCEVLSKKPYLVLDGAQNLASAQILKKALQDNFNYKKLILVLGISLDKDIFGICKVLEGLADKVILTQAKTKRAAPVAKIAKCFKTQPYLTHNIKAAQILARTLAKEDDLILVTGSLFVVGEYRNVERLS